MQNDEVASNTAIMRIATGVVLFTASLIATGVVLIAIWIAIDAALFTIGIATGVASL